MVNLGDLISEFLVRNQSSTTAGFYTDSNLTEWADQAHKWAAGYKKWPFTEGRVSTTYASLSTNEDGLLVGAYPEGWKPDSIRKLRIDGKNVEKKEFNKFLDFIEENPGDDERIFSDYGLQYFINPQIDLTGTVTVWGQYTPGTFDATDPTTNTVFAAVEELNEAIVEKMMSYAKKREKDKAGMQLHNQEANRILDEAWQRILDEQHAYQIPDGDPGMWERFDVLDGNAYSDQIKRDQF